MGKRILNLYADDSDIAEIRAKGINLSALFREFVRIELNEAYQGPDKDKIIAELKRQIAKQSQTIEELNKKVQSYEKDIKRGWRRTGEKITWN